MRVLVRPSSGPGASPSSVSTGSPTSSPASLRKMVEFCARHQIVPMVERLPMAQINTAIARLRQGDVLVTRNTGPAFNVVLPLLGAIVTDRGGQLSHAAIVAREYGIPAVVGTREATSKFPEGSRLRVNGDEGIVELLA